MFWEESEKSIKKNVWGSDMGYRAIFLTKGCRLSVKNEQLLIDNGDTAKIPLEDIGCIVADSEQVGLNTYLMMKLAEYAVTLIIDNKSHTPCGVYLPFARHSRHLMLLREQIKMTEPAKKKLWKQIVQKKIENQADVLKICGIEQWKEIDSIKTKVKSGDTSNMEGVAAARYFKLLFGKEFMRSQENVVNAMLNYGYAVFRSTIAKNLVVYGFEPSLGIHHKNLLNSFNLADDMIEPFRPIVDLFVKIYAEDAEELDTKMKTRLVDLLNMNVLMNGKFFTASRAADIQIQSLSGFISGKNAELILPTIVELERHRYE